jgi:hypothetical protein
LASVSRPLWGCRLGAGVGPDTGLFEPLMELSDVLLGIGPVLFVRDPVDSRAGILS